MTIVFITKSITVILLLFPGPAGHDKYRYAYPELGTHGLDGFYRKLTRREKRRILNLWILPKKEKNSLKTKQKSSSVSQAFRSWVCLLIHSYLNKDTQRNHHVFLKTTVI